MTSKLRQGKKSTNVRARIQSILSAAAPRLTAMLIEKYFFRTKRFAPRGDRQA